MLDPNKLDELLHPVFDKAAEAKAVEISRGLPASPGAASGKICFFAEAVSYTHLDVYKRQVCAEDTVSNFIAGRSTSF